MTDLTTAVAAAHIRYANKRPQSAAADERARRVLPGGNTRSVLDFEPFPFRVATAVGAEVVDLDGLRYVDFCGNYTAGLLGHSPTAIRDAIVAALDSGWAVGATHEREAELAELICARFASIDQVRFTNSGTEANLMAVGTALHHTGKSSVGVFDHGYHGGVLAFGDLGGPQNPLNVPHRFVMSAFDDVAGLDALFADEDLGCVLVEAVQGSGGCRPASAEFLHEIRTRCTEHGVVMILDEVMTSRLAPGGAQERFGITPDMTTLGKYLGGGMSFGAFGGKQSIMAEFVASKGGELTQAGTFNNNVVSLAAGIATLRTQLDADRLAAVNERGDRLRLALNELAAGHPTNLRATGLGSMVCLHTDDPRHLELLFHALLDEGLSIARRGFMALSMEITDADVERLITAIGNWLDRHAQDVVSGS
ncbi:MAG: aminotransferase class III-fold pyridoxal phosphate-dependent enzyme [Acidimicrobiales bacterium]